MGEARTYDAWGQVRSQVGTDGKLRYCANLGHKQDDESGLIYMRARYYEPASGRFLSEDLKRDSENWYAYAKNNPVAFADASGFNFVSAFQQELYALWFQACKDIYYMEDLAVIVAFRAKAQALAAKYGFEAQAWMIQLNAEALAIEQGSAASGVAAGIAADMAKMARDKAAEFGMQASIIRSVGMHEIAIMCMFLEAFGHSQKLWD